MSESLRRGNSEKALTKLKGREGFIIKRENERGDWRG
jgi:hypothetical protein